MLPCRTVTDAWNLLLISLDKKFLIKKKTYLFLFGFAVS